MNDSRVNRGGAFLATPHPWAAPKTPILNRVKENYKMTAIDLSKQQVLDADPRLIQQINFTENLDRAGNTTMFFIFEEAKETDFSQGTVNVL